MAHILENYTFRTQGHRTSNSSGPGGLKRYLDGQIWSLEPGVDSATTSPRSLRVTLMSTAKRHGYKIRTNVVEGKVIVQKIGDKSDILI